MSDLTDELRQLAAEATAHARPMAIADVIRRGNRRRTRTIAQRSIGGLSAVGLGAAVLFTGATHHLGSNPAASPGASSAGAAAVSVTQLSAPGRVTLKVTYRVLPTEKFKLVSVAWSGDFKKMPKNPHIRFVFGPGLDPARPSVSTGFTAPLHPSSPHNFGGSLGARLISSINKEGVLGKNGSVIVQVGTIHEVSLVGTDRLTATAILER